MPERTTNELSEAQVLAIAKRAVELAMEELPDRVAAKLEERFFIRIGKVVVNKLLWMIGIVAVGLYFWLQNKGLMPKS